MIEKLYIKNTVRKTIQLGGIVLVLTGLLLGSCRKEEELIPEEVIPVAPADSTLTEDTTSTAAKLVGFYLLNEGNMGSNKSTLDYFDFTTGNYHRNIFAEANPSVPKEMGDVGNDIKVYGNKLYAVINCSNKVEVMDKRTAKRLGQINIPNCRYIQFHNGYAYVTSYAGPVEINPDYEQIGYVAKVDTSSFQVINRCLVGFQPDELEIVGNKIYVANSGGYMVPNYESTVSVIDIPSFKEIKRIEVAINLHRLRADRYGNLWVTSRGDHYEVSPRLYWINTHTDNYGGKLDIAVSNMHLDGDSLYIVSSEWNNITNTNVITYGIIDVNLKQLVNKNFLAGGTGEVSKPSGIMVHPINKDIYITDSGNSVYPGSLYCFDKFGSKKWQVRTGNIPAHFALVYENY